MDHSLECYMILIFMGISATMAADTPSGYWNSYNGNNNNNNNGVGGTCQPITVNECSSWDIGYSTTSLADGNYFGHTNQDQVKNDPTFQALVRMFQHWNQTISKCSMDLKLFVCGLYLPRCIKSGSGRRLLLLPPCRSTCMRVKERCADIALDTFRIVWLRQVDCQNAAFTDSFDRCMKSVGNPDDEPMMVRDMPQIAVPASASLIQGGAETNCQCTCTPLPCHTP